MSLFDGFLQSTLILLSIGFVRWTGACIGLRSVSDPFVNAVISCDICFACKPELTDVNELAIGVAFRHLALGTFVNVGVAGSANHVRALIKCDEIVKVVATAVANDTHDLLDVFSLSDDGQGDLVA